MPTKGVLHFDFIANFRDVGVYTNSVSSTPHIKPHLLYRSARPDLASKEDLATLQALPIASILDLRTPAELAALDAHDPPSTHFPTTRVSLTGTRFRLALLAHLPVLQLIWCLLLLLFRQRLAAIRLLAAPMAKRGLAGMAADTLRASWGEVREVFAQLSERESWPVLVHCTQGKDRTGLIVLLLSLLAGVDRAACEADYMLSQRELAEGRDAMLEETRRYGLPVVFVDCVEGWVDKVVGHINETWGGVEGYLDWCGVPKSHVEAVKEILTASDE